MQNTCYPYKSSISNAKVYGITFFTSKRQKHAFYVYYYCGPIEGSPVARLAGLIPVNSINIETINPRQKPYFWVKPKWWKLIFNKYFFLFQKDCIYCNVVVLVALQNLISAFLIELPQNFTVT